MTHPSYPTLRKWKLVASCHSLSGQPSLLGEFEASSCLKEKVGVSQWDSVNMCSLSIWLSWDYSLCDGIDNFIKEILKIFSSHLPWEGTAKFCCLENKDQTLNKLRISVYGIVGNEAAPTVYKLSDQGFVVVIVVREVEMDYRKHHIVFHCHQHRINNLARPSPLDFVLTLFHVSHSAMYSAVSWF